MLNTGLITFRSYREFGFYRKAFLNDLDKASNAFFGYSITQRWLAIRLDLICISFGTSTAIMAVAFKNVSFIDKQLLIFSLTIVTDVIVMFSISIRMFTELSNIMVASQRIYEYTNLESEDELVKPGDEALKARNWPTQGEIEFDQVTMCYRKGMNPSLIDLSCKCEPGFKVGIVGRTGAGKSTILQVLFRLTDSLSGDILIDGVKIKDVGLHLLRQNVAYIPQSPFVIQGSIRENLDPFGEFTDEEVRKVLEEVKLHDHIRTKCDNGLLTFISENNTVFSLG
jgi:ATP-binding cassette, subfamily C (CFTR/MRP), member 4